MNSEYDSNKQLVTWEKYHCSAVINDCIKCPKCKGKLFLHLNQNKLICEECAFKAAADDMSYSCIVCTKDFTANLKIYNPIEFHVIKVSIKNALLFKTASKPDYLPCCKKDLKSLLNKFFFHKRECDGILYSGKWINNNIVVCSKCRMLSEVDKFIWTCPLCFQRFKSKNSSHNVNLNKIQLVKDNTKNKNDNNYNDKNSKEANEASYIQKDSRSKSPNIRINENNEPSAGNSFVKNSSAVIPNNINNNININNINFTERANSGNINTNLASSPNISNDLQNLIKSKNIEIDIENLKAEAGKFKNIISNLNLENNRACGNNNRRQTSEKLYSVSGVAVSNSNYNKIAIGDLSPNSRSPILSSRLSDEGCNININMRSPNDFKNNINRNLKGSYGNLNININNNNKRGDLSPNDRNTNLNPNNIYSNSKNFAQNQNNNNNQLIYNNSNKNINSNYQLQLQNSSSAAAKINNKQHLDAKETEAFNLLGNNNLDEAAAYDSREDENLKSFDCEEYKVITQIGEGSFGKIYLVEDKQKRQFSMKKIIANDEMDVENFTQEYELVNKVRHKNILRIHSICRRRLDSTTHALYILMEKGVTDWEKEIKARQQQKKFYSEKELFNIANQLTDALAFLQLRNISHRDIKPQNVLLFKEGVFKIADFGEAKKISIIETCKQLCTLRGTELYMSPLLFNGLRTGQNDIKHNSFKSDVFSLGFCLFYAATLSIHCLYELRREVDTFTIGIKLGRALKTRYSDNLVNVLLKMLEINESKRCDFVELQLALKNINF